MNGSRQKIKGQSAADGNPGRLYSLDALRGFDMFWITGGQKLVWALATVTGWPLFEWMNAQMHHVGWNGFAFYDMIFPLFLFLAGVSMPYSFAARKKRGDTREKIYLHALKRMLVLVLLGMLVNRILELNPDNMRFASVLGRIGVAWFLAALIVLNAKNEMAGRMVMGIADNLLPADAFDTGPGFWRWRADP